MGRPYERRYVPTAKSWGFVTGVQGRVHVLVARTPSAGSKGPATTLYTRTPDITDFGGACAAPIQYRWASTKQLCGERHPHESRVFAHVDEGKQQHAGSVWTAFPSGRPLVVWPRGVRSLAINQEPCRVSFASGGARTPPLAIPWFEQALLLIEITHPQPYNMSRATIGIL